MRSETSVHIYGSLNGNGFLLFPPFSHSTYPYKIVTEAECINAFPTKHPVKHQFVGALCETNEGI